MSPLPNLKQALKELYFLPNFQKMATLIDTHSQGKLFLPKNRTAIEAVETLIYKALTGVKPRSTNTDLAKMQRAINDNNFQLAAQAMAATARHAVSAERTLRASLRQNVESYYQEDFDNCVEIFQKNDQKCEAKSAAELVLSGVCSFKRRRSGRPGQGYFGF